MSRESQQAEHRAAIADAVWRIIRRDGFEAASVRTVAAETGLATGSVRHLFRSQDDLHVFAMEQLIAMMTVRVKDALASGVVHGERTFTDAIGGLSADPPVRQRVAAALIELLPVTDASSDLFLAHLQFVTRATVHPSLAPVARRTFDELQATYRNVVDGLVESGFARADLDRSQTVLDLATLMEGIVLRRLTAPQLLSTTDAVAQLIRFLDLLERKGAPC